MADEPDEKKEDAPAPAAAAPAESPAAPAPEAKPALSPLAEAVRLPPGMPVEPTDPREKTARWLRISILVAALLGAVGLLWSHYRTKPAPVEAIARARSAGGHEWAALSACLVGAPLDAHELASERMRQIWLGLSRDEQRAAETDVEAWPGRCAPFARRLIDAVRPVRDANRRFGELASIAVGVRVALSTAQMPRSVDALFDAALAAHLDAAAPPEDVSAPPPLDVPDRDALAAVSLEGANVHVEDADDHRVLLRGVRAVLCLIDDADRRFDCREVPGAGGLVPGLRLVPGTGARMLASARVAGDQATVVDLRTGAVVVTGPLAAAEVRDESLLAVRAGAHGTYALAAEGGHGPSLPLAVARGELLTATPTLAAATDAAGIVAWATVDARAAVALRMAPTGDAAAFAPGATERVAIPDVGPVLALEACLAPGLATVLLQHGAAAAPPALAADAGLVADAGTPDGGAPVHRSHAMPALAGPHPYVPQPTDLPVEREVTVVVKTGGAPATAMRAAVVSGDATLSCDAGAALVTVLGSAADRTGASDRPGQRPWRLREPGFRVTQLRCAGPACTTDHADLRGFRDAPDVRVSGANVVVFFRTSDAGGLRARVGTLAELAGLEDVILADDQVHGGIDVRERLIGTGPRGALMVARTSAGVLAWRVGEDGAPRLLSSGRR